MVWGQLQRVLNWITRLSPNFCFHLQVSFHFSFPLSSPCLSIYTSLSVHLSLSGSYQGDFEHCFHCDNQVSAWADSPLDLHQAAVQTQRGRRKRRVGVDLINLHLAGGDGSQVHITHSRTHSPSFTLPSCAEKSPRQETGWLEKVVCSRD